LIGISSAVEDGLSSRVTTAILVMSAFMTAGWAASAQTAAPPLIVAAASDLQAVLPDLLNRFERDTGGKAIVSFGSSGNFFAQSQNGAPFDVFFSADVDYPKQLVASRHADADSLYHYATGRIVLWTRKETSIDVRHGLKVLQDARVRRIAIANPEHAPYGRAALAALRYEKVYDAVKNKLVFGENISQAAQLADSGNADVGIIALSLALGPALRAAGTYAEIPATAHPPIEQAAVILTASRNKEAARKLLAYMKRSDVTELLARFGFAPPQSSAR
jgi:molybdate transport system substrate-binding protein